MADSSTNISEAELTRLLPTCQRCRRLRRKCDTQLPACRLCQKGKAECTFFDHALQQTLPRSYVHSLISRLGRLRSVQTAIGGDTSTHEPASSTSRHDQQSSAHTASNWQSNRNDVSFDKHFIVRNANPTCWQFFGSSSPLALAVEVLVHAQAKFGPVTHAEKYAGLEFALNKHKPEGIEPPEFRISPSRQEVEMLVNLYLSTTNVLHGYSDNESVVSDIDTYLRYHGTSVKSLTGNDAHQFFRVAMICSIAAANKGRHQPRYNAESCAYYKEGLQCVEEVTSDVSPEALQAMLLLILFSFFWPRKVDLWKLLDYACRLSVELHLHTETNDEFEDERSRQGRRSLFWGLYCLERTIGQHLGRPSDLPEEIITVEYPANLNVVVFFDQPSQYSLVSHYYRLMYIRSEIFRELYMPASAPDLSHSWYKSRLDQILLWQRESHGFDQIPGMGTMTCEMGFDTSICFLFQPLLLQALAATKDASLSPNHNEVIPRESYDAALRSISFYNRILRAEENTPAGYYPVTIVTAFYVHQITLTVMAHCLLAIDGRLPVVTFAYDFAISPSAPIDFHDIKETADTCIYLLTRIADMFPGMVGILDIFKNVSEKVVPVLTQGTGANAGVSTPLTK